MTKDAEFELVEHNSLACNIFIVNMLRRAPHVHWDFEVCLSLDSEVTVTFVQNSSQEQKLILHKGDVCFTNPFQTHSLNADSIAPILAVQVPPDFFVPFWPNARNVRFANDALCTAQLSGALIDAGCAFFDNDETSPLQCAENIIRVFRLCLKSLPHRTVSEKELAADRTRARRVARLTEYIDANCGRKLLLQELSSKEGVSLSHLSHVFTQVFGMPFQEYLSRVRCEKARLLMMANPATDLLDVSMACGFSDAKYFNRAFKTLYKVTPANTNLCLSVAPTSGLLRPLECRPSPARHLCKSSSPPKRHCIC